MKSATTALVTKRSQDEADQMTAGQNHRVALAVAAYQYATVDDLFENAPKRMRNPFFLILDELADPQPTWVRFYGRRMRPVHGIIIPKRSVGLTSVVAKTSTGYRTPDVRDQPGSGSQLQKRGVWLFGTDMQLTTALDAKALALVIATRKEFLHC